MYLYFLTLFHVPADLTDEPVLQRLLVSLADEEGGGGGGGGGGGKGAYFIRVMRLFESVPCVEWVVATATKGLQRIKKDDPAAVR